jgi:hypothetical protein
MMATVIDLLTYTALQTNILTATAKRLQQESHQGDALSLDPSAIQSAYLFAGCGQEQPTHLTSAEYRPQCQCRTGDIVII